MDRWDCSSSVVLLRDVRCQAHIAERPGLLPLTLWTKATSSPVWSTTGEVCSVPPVLYDQ